MYDDYYYYYYDTPNEGPSSLYYLFVIALSILMIVSMWRLFKKAGKPGWAAIVPLYNGYVLSEITFGSGWLFLLSFVPFVNAVYSVILCYKLGQVFGRSTAFSIGMIFLSPIFLPVLAFSGNSYYCGPAAASGTYIAGGKVPQGYGNNYYNNMNNQNNYSPDQFYGQNNNTYNNYQDNQASYGGEQYFGQSGNDPYGSQGSNNPYGDNPYGGNPYNGQNGNNQF